MKHLLLTLTSLAVLVAGPASASASARDRPALGVKLTACVTGLEREARSAAFSASMPAGERATGLAVRFVLQQRDGLRWTRVAVPGWGRWERADPGARGFTYLKRIEQLDAPATYRARVTFRWTAAGGGVVRRTVRTSSACRQPDVRPDLEAVRIAITSQADGLARYTVSLRNTGRADVLTPFGVALSVAGAELPRQELPNLEAGGLATLSWVGAPCAPGERVEVEVDPLDAIDEADEDDDVLSRRC